MVVQNKKTGNKYEITQKDWEKLKERNEDRKYNVVQTDKKKDQKS